MNTGIRIATAFMALALAACGSDGGGDKPASSITGVAATGDAISGGTVTLKCKGGGSVSTVTAVDGRYTLQADRLTLPCMARVSYTDGYGNPQILHSYALAPDTINITPLTEMVSGILLQHQPTDMFDNHIELAFTMLSQGDPAAAWNTVRTNLLTQGIRLPENFDPVRTLLQAKTDTQSGNDHDQLLDTTGLQLHVSLGSSSFLTLHLELGNSQPSLSIPVSLGGSGAFSTGSDNAGISGFFAGSSSPQAGMTYSITSPPTVTLLQAIEAHQLAGSYSGSLENGDSCSFQVNADGNVLLPGDDSADPIPGSAFSLGYQQLPAAWAYSDTGSSRQGLFLVRAATADTAQSLSIRVYEPEKSPLTCTATKTPASAT